MPQASPSHARRVLRPQRVVRQLRRGRRFIALQGALLDTGGGHLDVNQRHADAIIPLTPKGEPPKYNLGTIERKNLATDQSSSGCRVTFRISNDRPSIRRRRSLLGFGRRRLPAR